MNKFFKSMLAAAVLPCVTACDNYKYESVKKVTTEEIFGY